MRRMAQVHVVYPSGKSTQHAIKGVGAAKMEAKRFIGEGVAKIIVESYSGRIAFYWEPPEEVRRLPGRKYGADHGRHNAKLSDEAVRQIRNRYQSGERQVALAADFGVSVSTINRAIHGILWAHID